MKTLKLRIIWGILIWNTFAILCVQNWRNLKYLKQTLTELKKLIKKNSIYTEDGDYTLIHKNQITKEL